MIKKRLLAFGLSVLTLQNLAAAPYHMDAPIESYTWGESRQTVWESGGEGANRHKSGDTLIFVQKDDSALLFRLWHNQLVGMSRSYLSSNMTSEEKSAIYTRHLDEFTARWGKPALEQPCLASPLTCSEVIWYPAAKTQVSLYQSTAEADRPFVGYAYNSREKHSIYEQEIREFGPRYEPYYVLKTFKEKPDYAEKTLKGKRIRIEARIVSLSPLKLDKKGNEIICSLKSEKAIKPLKTGQLITVSGVVAGIEANSLILSDTIVVPYPEDGPLAIDRKGRPPQGFFTAETLNQQLETAANQVEKNFSIQEYVSAVRLEGNRAVVDFTGGEVPTGISFSLESLYKDRSSDTLAFNMNLQEDDASKVNAYFMLAVIGIVIKASQPDASMDEIWEKIVSATKKEKGKEKGKVIVNGWTYQMDFRGESYLTFSATAPRRRK